MSYSKYLVCLDGGHGENTGGKRTPTMPDGSVIKENQFNDDVIALMKKHLEYLGFTVLDVAPETNDTSLSTRISRANARYKSFSLTTAIYVSIHYDAYTGSFDSCKGGNSIFYYPGSIKGKKLATAIYKYLVQGTEQASRGVKTANYYVLRKTAMPAVLSENGFMDVLAEAKLMLNEDFQKEVSNEHVKGICKYFGLTYKAYSSSGTTSTSSSSTYKVQAGSFASKTNAKNLVRELKKDGYSAFYYKD
jgi:N-acetylmuramoyl-L-alanine amidase